MFKHPFSFNGRIRRLEYGLSIIIAYASAFVVALALVLIFSPQQSTANFMPLVLLLVAVPFYWFFLAQGAKRCHDLGNSGWFQLIPLYGLWMLFANSEHGDNRFGPNPKGIGNVDEIDRIGGYLQQDQAAAV